ncbi:MAG: cation diffusion facilitator family transporter, partial [Calditrichia bacterium]|nr:cation diffusion facilitator family transporter [Calditrichia bacterium]
LLGEPVVINESVALLAMGITVVIKLIMGVSFFFSYKKLNSPAIKAAMADAVNDVLIAFVVIAGILGVKFGVSSLDSIAGLLVGGIVIYTGIKVGKENIDYLMGKVAPEEIVLKIKKKALSIKGVKAINDIFSHYIGNVIHVEVHIEVDPKMQTKDSHDLAKIVQKEIESIYLISRAFIHVDPHLFDT